jgi:pimeloyl-ACP methyl ester carboxylesterase
MDERKRIMSTRIILVMAALVTVLARGAACVPQGEKSVKKATSKDGTAIAFDQRGSGPVLVLVSGALSARSSGDRLATLLAPHFTVVNYDRRGRGDSGDTRPYAVEREIEDIAAVIDAVGGSAFVFGSSSGAALALEATVKLPARIRKQALFEPPFIVDDSRPPVPADFVARVTELVAADRRSEAVEYFMRDAVGIPPEFLAGMKKSPMWAGMEKLAHTLPYDGAVMGDTQAGKPLPEKRWASVTAPTLVMDGERSDAFLRNAAKALAKIIPNAKHRTLEGQDHSVAFMAPQALVPVLVEFFQPSAKPDAAASAPASRQAPR